MAKNNKADMSCARVKKYTASDVSNGFLTLAGGIIITFAKEILTLITG